MSRTANPAVVIGLGGTGQWVLTYVKKSLVETYGKVPDTVQLLAFDTTSDQSDASVESEKEEQAQVGNITLDPGEFVFLGGNIRRICEEIGREDKHKHIGSWLQAKYYLNAQDDDSYEISKGAGRRRPFGRMAVFYDLMQGQPKILGKIDQALTKVKTASQQTKPIEVYIITSLAGGTGSGMFIDFAQLVRDRAKRAQLTIAVRGFLVLQNTFTPVAQISDVQPKAFAAMRELERFMLVFNRDYPMYYTDDPSKRHLQTVYRSKLFDNCYLLDARRANLPLDGIAPKLGVFPAVAECVNVLLDPETGNTFDQHYKNVNERLATAQQEVGKALYSSLGTYTYILPVDDIIERNTYKLALHLLKGRLVGLEHDEGTDIIRLSTAKVLEFDKLPRDEAKDFLRAEQSRSNVKNLVFCQNMAVALDRPLDQTQVVQSMAEQGVGLLAWLEPIEQDQTMVQAGNRIKTVLETSLVAEVATAKVHGDDYVTASNRIIREIRDIRARMLGQEDVGGRRTVGEFEQGLQEYSQQNHIRFQRLLAEKLSLMLNGVTEDQIAAKTAKLPYSQDFLQALLRGFEDFEGFLERVIAHRAKEGSLLQAKEYVQDTRQTMQDTVYANSLIDKMRGTAIKAEEAYIQNEDYLFDLQREEILYQALLGLTRNLKDIVKQAKQSVDSWIAALALGQGSGSNEVGLYKALLAKQSELKRRRDEQKRIRVYEYLTDDAYEDELYGARIGEKQLGDILRRFRWQVSDQARLDLRLFYDSRRSRDDEESELVREPLRRQETATNHNMRLLLDNLRLHFQDIRNETLADRMSDALTPARAAKEMVDSSDALINHSGYQQGYLEKHNFVCVNRGVQVNYFTELENQLKRSAPNDKDNQVIGLNNKHRCTILSTLDLLVGQHVNPYETGARSYQDFSGDRRLLHNFPAEVHASLFENKLTRPPLSEAGRLLAPELVALLEDQMMVRRFVLAWVYGLIREEQVPDQRANQYVLRLDTTSRKQRRSEQGWKICLTRPSDSPSFLEAMTNFVFVHLDPNTGTRSIKDVAPESNIMVPPERIDKVLNQLEASTISGRESVVQAFTKLLNEGQMAHGKVADVLTNEGAELFRSAFRSLLADWERELNRQDMDKVHSAIVTMVEENTDCYEEKYAAELITTFNGFIDVYKGGEGIKSGGYARVIKQLERYIDSRVQEMRKDTNQLIKDLGSITYMVLWDEIERLERLRDQQK